MKRILATLFLASPLMLAACSDGGDGSHLLGNGQQGAFATDPESQAAGEMNTFEHPSTLIGGDNGITDPGTAKSDEVKAGGAEIAARLHALQKMPYGSLGRMLGDFGVNLGNNTAGSAAQLYKSGASALGVAIYANRVPEQYAPSTSSLAKQFDIYTAAAPEIVANITTASKRCPGVMLIDTATNQFTEDGISCLLGKPAKSEHVMLANALVAQATTPQIGQQIAIAQLLAAAHTSQ
jgi:hypothetical protein